MIEVSDWFATTTSGHSLNEVSKRSGIPIASLHRYTQNRSFTAESVVKIARAFESSVPDALIAHGVVTAAELGSVAIAGTLADASDQQLLDEIARRLALAPEGASEVWDTVAEQSEDATVHYPKFAREPADDELAVAHERTDDPNDTDEHFS